MKLVLIPVLALALANTAWAKPPLTDGENAHNLACSFFEFYELEIKGKRFHCPQYDYSHLYPRTYWGKNYGVDSPFVPEPLKTETDPAENAVEEPVKPAPPSKAAGTRSSGGGEPSGGRGAATSVPNSDFFNAPNGSRGGGYLLGDGSDYGGSGGFGLGVNIDFGGGGGSNLNNLHEKTMERR